MNTDKNQFCFCPGVLKKQPLGNFWAIVLLILLGSALALPAAFTIHYQGQDKCHISYSYSNPQALTIELRANAPDNSWRVIDAGFTSLSSQRNDENLAAGTHFYEMREQVRIADPDHPGSTIVVWQTLDTARVTLDAMQVGGTLLYDETIEHDAYVRDNDLIVPAGKTLRINGVQVSSFLGFIDVHGQIRFDPAAVVSCLVRVYSPHVFANIGAVNLYFRENGGSSTIRDSAGFSADFEGDHFSIADCISGLVSVTGHGLTLTEAQIAAPSNSVLNLTVHGDDITLSGLRHIGLSLAATGTTYLIDCDIRECGQTFVLTNSNIRLQNVTWRGSATTFRVPVTLADKCDFQTPITTEQSVFRASNCKFGAFHAYLAPAGQVELSDCLFAGNVGISAGAPQFNNCEFGAGMTMNNRNAAIIKNCIFLDSIVFRSDADLPQLGDTWYATAQSPNPQIANNAFLGESALKYSGFDPVPATPNIPIGANYYGDARGVRVGLPGSEFLGRERGHSGAWVASGSDSNPFTIAPPLAANVLQRRDTRVFPRLWLNGWIAGQYSIPHIDNGNDSLMFKGRETLVSLDILTSETNLSGLRVYAEFDGQTIPCRFTGPIHRDRAAYKPHHNVNGQSTFDVALPPVTANSAALTVYLDASQVTGYDAIATPQAPIPILTTTLSFDRTLYTRPIRFAIVPVQITGLLFDSALPDASAVDRFIRKVLPEMIPIAPDRLIVDILPPVQVLSSGAWISAVPLLNKVSILLKAAQLSYNQFMADGDNDDFMIGVLPAGSIHTLFGIGRSSGANLALRRDVIIVDESKPDAAIHELGHAIGLNTGWRNEQYELKPPNGRRLEAFTAFTTSGKDRPDKFTGLFRAMHFPGNWYNWFEDFDWWDVMSNADDTIWPDMTTLDAFVNWLDNREATMSRTTLSRTTLTSAPRVPSAASPAPGYRRVLLQGITIPVGSTIEEVFVVDTLTAFDATELGFPEIKPDTSGFWRASHTLRGYDAANAEVFSTRFFIPLANGGLWQATFDLPDSLASYTVTRDDDSLRFLQVHASGRFSNQIHSPTPGTQLQDTLELDWSATATGLQHLVVFSTNAGVSWLAPGLPRIGTHLSTPTDFLPATRELSIRLYSSDGLATAISQVDGVIVANRRPRVTILSPLEGDLSVTNVTWQLTADVSDPDGNLSSPGYWWSSLGGILATGRVASVILTQGVHTLRYVATDLAGLSTTSSCSVRVYSTLTSTDLALTEDSMHLRSQQVDPVSAVPLMVAPGVTNSVFLEARNQGVDGSARFSIFMQPSAGPEVLLAQKTVPLIPFGRQGIRAEFFPTTYGTYTIRGMVDQILPGDSVPANNQYTWSIPSRQPAIAPSRDWMQVVYMLSPGEVPGPFSQYRAKIRIEVANQGTADLRVGLPTIIGDSASVFTLVENTVTGMPISPDQASSPYLMVEATMTTPGLFRGTLLIPSDDPRTPVYRVTLFALLAYPDQSLDSDGDGVLDRIEAAIGWNPNQRDSDADGLEDLLEDRNLNGIVDVGETSPFLADTDGDGVPDGMEDLNHNGRQDYGESSPTSADTDGDGMSDGAEALAGTHPFVASDYLFCTLSTHTNPPLVRWQGKAGRQYQVLRSTNTTTWADAPTASGANQQSARIATTNTLFEYSDPTPPARQGYYRVGVDRGPGKRG